MIQHSNWFIYFTFSVMIAALLIYDLGVFSFSNAKPREDRLIRLSVIKTCIWLAFGLLFSLYIHWQRGNPSTMQYITAFLMEWSLSIDNVFVFILLFSQFQLEKRAITKTLLIGVVLAVLMRIVFIAVGISLIAKFQWLFYVFAIFLVYTGVQILVKKEAHSEDNKFNKMLSKWLHIKQVSSYKFFVRENNRWYPTSVVLVIILIAITDITFALDSIPAVLAISQDTLIVYTSNIFAVMGLRSLFFALQGAKDKFKHLPKGIAAVLIFIGVKIFLAEYFHFHVTTFFSLGFIVLAFTISVVTSIHVNSATATPL